MRTISFVALQCFQCSTMQVKQLKKSSNKWTCVVCNQNQSVRNVFAQGPLAKDLRLFVQSFNMSRKVVDEQGSPIPETPMPTSLLQGGKDCARKRRSDWTEYLDLERVEEDEEEGDLGPRVVTELPKELFRKPKLKNYARGSNNGGCNGLYKPVFSKRSTSSILKTMDKDSREHQTTKANKSPRFSNSISRNDGETKNSQTAEAHKASKWSSYLMQEDEELKVGSARSDADKMSKFRHDDAWETPMTDYKVEDDVHPDFM